MGYIWNGIDVDVWGSAQTLNPRPVKQIGQWYSGYDFVSLHLDWWDFIPAIPLDIRYDSFKRRLARALEPKSKQR